MRSTVVSVSSWVQLEPSVTDGRIYPSRDPAYLPGLADVDVAAGVGRGYDWPLVLENDANLALLGERWRGAAQGVEDAVLLIAGERIGAGILAAGQLVRGFSGGAGELGFLSIVQGVGDTSGVGSFVRAAGVAAVRAGSAADPAGNGGGRSLYSIAHGDPAEVTGKLVSEAARQGDPVALQIVQELAVRFSRIVGVLSTLLDPELVIIGGAVADIVDLIHDRVIAGLPPFVPRSPRLLASRLGETGVVVGAVRAALDRAHTDLRRRFTSS